MTTDVILTEINFLLTPNKELICVVLQSLLVILCEEDNRIFFLLFVSIVVERYVMNKYK